MRFVHGEHFGSHFHWFRIYMEYKDYGKAQDNMLSAYVQGVACERHALMGNGIVIRCGFDHFSASIGRQETYPRFQA
jgi:hypothetical protein